MQKHDKNEKKIRIACQGAATINIDDLINFQGDLKILPESSYQRLRASILTLGFSFPVQAWKHGKKVFILDAHQRIETLKRLRDEEGFEIPDLPVSWVEASSREEAARKLLAATSQYGEITHTGLFDFMKEYKIDLPTIETQFQFPEINLKSFGEAFFTPPTEVSFNAKPGSKEIDSEDFEKFEHTCPKCAYSWD